MKYQTLSTALLTVTAAVVTQNGANAFTLVYDDVNSGNGQYVYDIVLEADEGLVNSQDSLFGVADVLNFSDLAGVTDVQIEDFYSVIAFDSTTVELEVSTSTMNNTGSASTLENIVTIFSNAPVGTINFNATFDEGDGFQFGSLEDTTTGPTAIPEPLTLLGTATALGFGALFKRQRKN